MRHLSYLFSGLFSAAVLFAGACGGGGDPGSADMATGGGGGGDMATGDMANPDMADNKPIITLTINQLAPATGPCMGMATIKGKGTITDSAGKLTCNGTTCTGTYTKGQMITLTATPDATTSAFSTWGGACKSNGQDPTQPTCTVTVDGTTTINADFIRSYYVSVQLTDMTAQMAAIRVYSDMAATQKIAEVLPSANSITTTTCIDKVKGDVVYAGVLVPAGKNLFGPMCALPTVCKYEVTGGTQIYWRVY